MKVQNIHICSAKILVLMFPLLFISIGTSASVQDADTTAVLPDTVVIQVVPDTIQLTTVPTDTTAGSEPASQADGESSAQEDASGGEATSDIAQIRELISFSKVLYTLLLLFATYYINKYVSLILDNFSEKTTNYRLFIKRLSPISRIIIWSTAIYIIIAGVIVPPFETVITIAASVGIAVGFASQDILRNIFGGIMIILDRPFQVGDKIEVGQHYGEVLSIGLRSSRVVTPDDSVVSIPNGELMNRAVSNSNSSALDCQVVAEIYLPATVNVQKVKEIAYKAVYSSSYTFLNKPVVVIVLNEIHNMRFVVKLRVKAYVVDIRYEFLFKSDMTEMILQECNRLGYIPMDSSEIAHQKRPAVEG